MSTLTVNGVAHPVSTARPRSLLYVLRQELRLTGAKLGCGVGGLLGAGLLLALPTGDRRRWTSHFALAYGAVVALTALLPRYWGLPPLMVLAGAAMTASNTSANTLLQEAAPAQ